MTPYETDLLEYLLTFLTARRRKRFAEVIAQRTRHLTVALEDVFQSHNIGAVLRSCDAFGLQDTHVVESRNAYEPAPETSLGSEQWLSVHRHSSTTACLESLRTAGYRIAATVPGPDSRPLDEVAIDQPLALWFGTEKDGLSREVIAAADELVSIPMYGFVSSFNVSVAAALCLRSLTGRLRGSRREWGLRKEERPPLLLEWCRQSIPNIEAIEGRFHEEWRPGANVPETEVGSAASKAEPSSGSTDAGSVGHEGTAGSGEFGAVVRDRRANALRGIREDGEDAGPV